MNAPPKTSQANGSDTRTVSAANDHHRDGQSLRRNAVPVHRERQILAEAELRRVFDDVVEQPVPFEFLELLRQMDEGSRALRAARNDVNP